MVEQIVLTKKCPVCGQEIRSLYQTQLDYNYDRHFFTHAKKRGGRK